LAAAVLRGDVGPAFGWLVLGVGEFSSDGYDRLAPLVAIIGGEFIAWLSAHFSGIFWLLKGSMRFNQADLLSLILV